MFSINKVLSRLKIHMPVVKSIISNIEFIEDKDCEIAYTDGKKVYYNPSFFETINTSEQEFTICHEILHILLGHIKRTEDRNIKIWNCATDAVINQILVSNGLTMPEDLVDCPEAINYTSEGYYDFLLKQSNLEQRLKKYEQSGSSTHTKWTIGPADETLEDGKNKQGENTESNEDTSLDERELNKKNKEMVKKESSNYIKGIDQEVKSMDSLASEEIGEAKEVLNWHSLLSILKRKVVSGDYDFFNGYFDEEGIYRYPYTLKRVCPVEILIDTSISVQDELVIAFLRECKNILREVPIDIGCFDTRFYGFQRIETKKDIEKFKIEGRGATDFDIAVNSFTPKAKLKIIFTDGCADMPKKEDNIYWFVYSNRKINPPGGKVYYVDEQEILRKGKAL